MPDQHDPDKVMIGVRVERTLKARLKKLAAQEKLSLSDLIRPILHEATSKITLSSKDYEQIVRDTRKAEEALEAKRSDGNQD